MKTFDEYLERAEALVRDKQVSFSVAMIQAVTSVHNDITQIMTNAVCEETTEEDRQLAKWVFKQLHGSVESAEV